MARPERARRGLGRGLGWVKGGGTMAGVRWRTRGALVLAYHDVGAEVGRADYCVSPVRFRSQLQSLREWGVQFVPLHGLLDRLASGQSIDSLAAVTFDDALAGVRERALPILLDLGVPATVFVVSDRLGVDAPEWYPGAQRTMTADELGEVADAGVTIGSHSRTHADLPTLDDPRLRDELGGSRAVIERLVDQPVDLVAYPFGHHDRRVRAAVEAEGYRAAFTFLNGRITAEIDRYRLPRLNMWSGQGRFRLACHMTRPAWSWGDHQLDAVSGVGPRLLR